MKNGRKKDHSLVWYWFVRVLLHNHHHQHHPLFALLGLSSLMWAQLEAMIPPTMFTRKCGMNEEVLSVFYPVPTLSLQVVSVFVCMHVAAFAGHFSCSKFGGTVFHFCFFLDSQVFLVCVLLYTFFPAVLASLLTFNISWVWVV